MRRICLTLPTNRSCPATIEAIGAEAIHAADNFDVEVHLLILDSCDTSVYEEHAAAVRRLPEHPRVVPHHLSEAHQKDFLERAIDRAEAPEPESLLGLMLPESLSYGACTNRAFLISFALGCESVHRRDSDSRYQVVEGTTVFPIDHELASLGRPAVDVVRSVSQTELAPELGTRPVSMVGGSFIGPPSVDIAEIEALDRDVYHDVVSLWAPLDWSPAQKRELVDESFKGAGTAAFDRDHTKLSLVDPMRVDMCNIAFHGVHGRVPLPPATDTIGSDYFLIHLVHDAGLPGVLHNRNIVNFHTAERRTEPGFLAYQTRFAKFLLSMLYFNVVYDALARAGDTLLDDQGQVRTAAVVELLRGSIGLDPADNHERLRRLDTAYRKLGGRYAAFADHLRPLCARLLAEAKRDMEDFALLTEEWERLVGAARHTPVHRPGGGTATRGLSPRLAEALASADHDRIVLDLDGIGQQYATLLDELPGIDVRFAMKACPVDEVITHLAAQGCGVDAASLPELAQALRAGVPVERVHYGNTIKSDQDIAAAHRMGITDFATDSIADVTAIAAHAPGARVFCRVATAGGGALWGLKDKFGCSPEDAVRLLETARTLGLTQAGLSAHVGSQQMDPDAWYAAVERIDEVLGALGRRGIVLDHVNLGGGLPALGYTDRRGVPLDPPIDKIFTVLREGMAQLRRTHGEHLRFIMEPGRFLVADQGAVRGRVVRLSEREMPSGGRWHWLYLSCGKFNGLYEMDALQYRLVFPTHRDDAPTVPVVVAGPTCDSDDSYAAEHRLVRVPRELASGDPVWVLSTGAYGISYMTKGFNGVAPLPCTTTGGGRPERSGTIRIRPIAEDDWETIVALESDTYTGLGLCEGPTALRSRADASPGTCFVLEIDGEPAGYLLALPYPAGRYPDLEQPEESGFSSHNLHLHDIVIAPAHRRRGRASHLVEHLYRTARSQGYERISLVAVGGSEPFWSVRGFTVDPGAAACGTYQPGAVYMSRSIPAAENPPSEQGAAPAPAVPFPLPEAS